MAKRYDDNLFAQDRKGRTGLLIASVVLLILLGMVFIYNLFYNTRPTLHKQSVTINDLPSSLEGFKILHISDLDGQLFGSMQEQLLSAIGSQSYQAVCVTGDITDSKGNPRALVRLMSGLKADIPVLFIAGDEDPQPVVLAEDGVSFAYAPYIRTLQDAGAVYLDAPYAVTHNGATVWFAPEMLYSLDVEASRTAALKRVEELTAEAYSDTQAFHLASARYTLDRFSRLEEAQKTMTASDIYVALTHVPLSSTAMRNLHDSYANGNSIYIDGVSLVLAGHYNAGQWRIPALGALYVPPAFSLSRTGFFPDEHGLTGLQSMMGVTQYVSPGLGASDDYPFPLNMGRFLNRPAVTLITLTNKLTNN